MPASEGLATLSFHKNLEDLVKFIKHLADSLSLNREDMPSELLELVHSPTISVSDLSSGFSGFSFQSEET